jgi:hypothetical protein
MMTFSKPDLYGLANDMEEYRRLSKAIIHVSLFFGYIVQVGGQHYQRTHKKSPTTGFDAFQYVTELPSTSSVQSITVISSLLKSKMLQNNSLDKRTRVKEEKVLNNDAMNVSFRPYFKDQRCFFIYSCRAFSNSSLTFRADPVFATTNCIHSFQTCLLILIEVLAFVSLSWLNTHELPFMVIKVNGNYHKLNIEFCGIMVSRYNGSTSEIQLQTKMQSSEQEDTTIR